VFTELAADELDTDEGADDVAAVDDGTDELVASDAEDTGVEVAEEDAGVDEAGAEVLGVGDGEGSGLESPPPPPQAVIKVASANDRINKPFRFIQILLFHRLVKTILAPPLTILPVRGQRRENVKRTFSPFLSGNL
jgi:hypothetical protein